MTEAKKPEILAPAGDPYSFLAAVAAGADGLMIEVHPEPREAWSDGPQSLKPARFAAVVQKLRPVAAAVGREI